jgi:hypothetical protein
LKWPELAGDGPVFHGQEVLLADDVDIAGEGAEDIADRRGLGHGHDLEAVHDGLQGL